MSPLRPSAPLRSRRLDHRNFAELQTYCSYARLSACFSSLRSLWFIDLLMRCNIVSCEWVSGLALVCERMELGLLLDALRHWYWNRVELLSAEETELEQSANT